MARQTFYTVEYGVEMVEGPGSTGLVSVWASDEDQAMGLFETNVSLIEQITEYCGGSLVDEVYAKRAWIDKS